jgi:hypothetical protein
MEKRIIRNNEPCASVSKSETIGASSITCYEDETAVCVNTAAIDNSVTQNGVKYFPNSF